MKRIFKLVLVVTIILGIYIPVNAIELGKTEKITFPESSFHEVIGDSDYITYYSNYKLYKYNLEANSFTEVYTSEKRICNVYLRNDIAYIWHESSETNKTSITAYNLKTKKVEYTNVISQIRSFSSTKFAVDSNGRSYFVGYDNGKQIINIYDKNSNKKTIYLSSDESVGIMNFTPNDEYLLLNYKWYANAFIKLNNKELTDGTVSFTNGDNQDTINFKFTSDSSVAITQKGRIAKFDYDAEKISITLTKAYSPNRTYLDKPVFYESSDKYYVPNDDGYLLGLNKKTNELKEKVLVKENSKIIGLTYYNNYLYAITKDGDNYYVTKVDFSKKIESKHIVLNTHKTLKYTQAEVINKYKENLPKYNYNNSVYKTTPVTKSPFSEGSLQAQVETDTLNQLNYFRWLVGVPSVTLNSAKQSRNQKCALILAINKQLSHTPTQPAGMDDAFYKEGYAGCNIGIKADDYYEGNASFGDMIVDTPAGYIDDSTNMVNQGVGHRSSMLNPFANKVSFGYVNSYSAMSMYIDLKKTKDEMFYAWPPAGYVPVESMIQYADTKWSYWLDESIKPTNTTKVTFTYNNKKYEVLSSGIWHVYATDSRLQTLYFWLPSDFRSALTEGKNGANSIKAGSKVHVNVTGLTDGEMNTFELDYDINFIQADLHEAVSISLDKKEVSLPQKSTTQLNVTFNPTNTSDKTITWTSSDNKVATVDKNGKVTAVSEGTATITAKTANGKTATCKVTVLFNLPFKDVKSGDWFYGSVVYAYKNGIIAGYSDTKFAPNDKITRGQLVTILWRLENYPKATKNNSFKDVSSKEYYYDAIKWAAENKIVNGYSSTKFGPDDPIIRQDLAVMLNNYARYKKLDADTDYNLKNFKDYKKIGDYAEIALKWAAANKVMSGSDMKDGKYINPGNNATRAETAAMVSNFIISFKIIK